MNNYKSMYTSLFGDICLTSDGTYLTGLWFLESWQNDSAKDFILNDDLLIFKKTKKWLDDYFNFKKPDLNRILIKPSGTEFSMLVWDVLKTISYGETLTYGEVAKIIADKMGVSKMSAQAVGRATGRNPISIIIPCHRVIGTDGSLKGYASGINKKKLLLNHEKI